MATIPYGTQPKFDWCLMLNGEKNKKKSGYSTTGVHGTRKKFSCSMPSLKKKMYFCFCLKYYCMGLRKIQSTLTEKKKILAAVLLWYMGLWKTQLALDPNRKIYIFSFPATVLLWYTELAKYQSRWTITEMNIFSLLTTVLLWCTGLRNFLIGTWPHRKNCFYLQY